MDSIEEFSRKYNGTYVRYKSKTGTEFTAFINGVDTLDNLVSLELHDGGIVSGSYPRILGQLTLEIPDSGYFNYNGFALYLFKVPARQWRRGMCSENCELYNPFRRLFKESVYRPMFGITTANSIFKKNYKSPEQAIELLSTKKLASCALNRTLALSKSPMVDKSLLLWYKTNPVGLVHHDKFYVLDELHEQEITDELTRSGFHSWTS